MEFGRLRSLDNDAVRGTRKVFKIFVGGHGGDFSCERQIIREIMPEVCRLCMEHDISFDVIDLQYAYPDTPSSMFPALSVLEMKSCISEANVGIRHIGLIGNSVGICPLPLQIGRAEYASVLERLDSEEDRELLSFWYEKEEGCVPVRYKLLQPLYASPIIQDGADLDDLSTEEKIAAYDEYRRIEAKLKRIFCISPSASLLNQELSMFLDSETHGQGNTLGPKSLIIFRHLNSITATDAAAQIYTDFTLSGELNSAAASFLESLQESVSHISAAGHSLVHFTINWHPMGIMDLVSAEHKAYLAAFASTIRSRCTASVEQAALPEGMNSSNNDFLASEILDQWKHAQALYDESFSLPETDHIIGLLLKPFNRDMNKPVLVLAPMGCGKSHVMAALSCKLNAQPSKSEQQTRNEDNANPHAKVGSELPRFVITRFVNATSQSSTLTGLISSICQQLVHILDCISLGTTAAFDSVPPDAGSSNHRIEVLGEESLEELTISFVSLLSTISDHALVFILIDGLDECPCRFHVERSVDWVPSSLPRNVRMVLSLNGQTQAVLQESCAESLKERINGPIVGLSPLSTAYQKEVVEALLSRTTLPLDTAVVRRKMPKDLHEQLLAMSEASNPFFLSLFVRLWCWDSRSAVTDSGIPLSLHSLIAHILELVTVAHGEHLVNSVLGLFVAAERVATGLTELELVDLLSTMDPVLEEMSSGAQQQGPGHSVRAQHKRMRRMLWVALKQDLLALGVLARCYDEVDALWCLSHPCFAIVARQRQVLEAELCEDRE